MLAAEAVLCKRDDDGVQMAAVSVVEVESMHVRDMCVFKAV